MSLSEEFDIIVSENFGNKEKFIEEMNAEK